MANKFNVFGKVMVSLICMAPLCLYIYSDTVKNEKLLDDTVTIDVLKQSVDTGTVIDSIDMFKTIRVDEDYVRSNPDLVISSDDIIGKQAVTKILGSTPVLKQSFEDVTVFLEDNEMVFSIAPEWIVSTPDSIRRGDNIFLYAIKSSKWATSENISFKELDTSKPVVESVVIYAKDSTNREVVTVGGTSSDDRYDGTSTVDNLEIKLTEEDFAKLKNYHDNGYEFIISYK